MKTWVVVAIALAAASVRADEAPKAAEIYATRCAFCHGDKGAGDGIAGGGLKPPPTNFARGEYWKSVAPEQVRAAIANGKPGTAMIPFATTLSAAEIDALVPYLKTFAP